MTGIFGRLLESHGKCDECGKDHEGNYLLGTFSDGRDKVTCDKCRRLHDEADRLMGVLKNGGAK
jgi:hypothetical protein